MHWKRYFYAPLLKEPTSPRQWIIKSDQTERNGESKISLSSFKDGLKAKVELSFLEGKEGPVGFINFRRKESLFFALGLRATIQANDDLNLALSVKSQSGTLFLYDLQVGPEEKTFYVNWRSFYPSFRGKRISIKEKLCPYNIQEMGILIQRSKQAKDILYDRIIHREIFLRPDG